MRVRDIMTTDIMAVTPDTSLLAAMQLLASNHVTGAPVLAGTRVVGVVSASDLIEFSGFDDAILRAEGEALERADWARDSMVDAVERGDEAASALLVDLFSARQDNFIDRPTDGTGSDAELLAEHDVSEVMSRKLWTVGPDDPADSAARLIGEARMHRLLVMDRGSLVGIVTTTDVARAVADGRLVTRTYVFNEGTDFAERGD